MNVCDTNNCAELPGPSEGAMTKLQKRNRWRISLLKSAREDLLSDPNGWLDSAEKADVSWACPTLTRIEGAMTVMAFARRAELAGREESCQKLRSAAFAEFPTLAEIEARVSEYSM